jgi:HNH endonuclease
MTMLDRFWAQIDDGGGSAACWPWRGARSRGYGMLYLGRPSDQRIVEHAHRLAYELHHREPIPPGMTIDHLCRVRHCVNPRHLEVVSRGENVLRGAGTSAQHARATHCIAGHPFDAANTYRTPRGVRMCRACKRRRDRVARRLASRLGAW